MKWQLCIATILLSVSLYGQNICGQNRYLEEVFSDVEITTGIEFANVDPYGLINNQTLRLDIYEPDGDTLEERPLIVHAFGGGFLIGTRNEPDIPNWGAQYAKRGFVFVSIDYRLGFNALDQGSVIRAAYRSSQDLRAALRFLSDSAQVYGIDLDNVFLTGSSAGCFAALIQTFMNESDRPSSTYGTVLEPQDLGCSNCAGNNNNNNMEVPVHGIVNNWGAILDTSFINISRDPADDIPVISFHGTNDLIVPYSSGYPFNLPVFPIVHGSELIHDKLNQEGVYNRLYTLQGLGHEPELINRWVTDTIVVNASSFLYEIMRPKLDSISGMDKVCFGRHTQYSVPLNLGSQYCWEVSGGAIISDSTNSIEVEWLNLGLGSVTVTEYNDIHAKTSLIKFVEVGEEPIHGFQYSSNNGLFDFNAYDSSSNYLWDFGDGSSTSFLESPQHQYSDTGKFVVELLTSNYYCVSQAIDTVDSDLCPIAEFDVTPEDSTVLINNQSLYGTTAVWDFGNGEVYSGFTPQPIYSLDGEYTIQLILSNNFCRDTISKTVEILHCPIANFDFVEDGLSLDIINNSSNNFFNYWSFGNGQNSRLNEPLINYDTAGFYEIELIVFNERACSDTLLKVVYLEPRSEPNNDSSQVVLFTQTLTTEELEIYPIPTDDVLNIKLPEDMVFTGGVLSVWNLYGKRVMNYNEIPTRVNLKELASGLYLVQFSLNGEKTIKKVIKR